MTLEILSCSEKPLYRSRSWEQPCFCLLSDLPSGAKPLGGVWCGWRSDHVCESGRFRVVDCALCAALARESFSPSQKPMKAGANPAAEKAMAFEPFASIILADRLECKGLKGDCLAEMRTQAVVVSRALLPSSKRKADRVSANRDRAPCISNAKDWSHRRLASSLVSSGSSACKVLRAVHAGISKPSKALPRGCLELLCMCAALCEFQATSRTRHFTLYYSISYSDYYSHCY